MSSKDLKRGKALTQGSIWQPTHVAQLFLGPLVWALWFVALYGGLSIGCAVAAPAPATGAMNWLNGSLLVGTLGASVWLFWWAWRCWRAGSQTQSSSEPFIPRVAAGIHLFASGATLFIGLPIIALPPCV